MDDWDVKLLEAWRPSTKCHNGSRLLNYYIVDLFSIKQRTCLLVDLLVHPQNANLAIAPGPMSAIAIGSF